MILRPARAITLRGGRLAKGSNHICMDHNELCSARSAWDEEGDLLVQLIYGEQVRILGSPRRRE